MTILGAALAKLGYVAQSSVDELRNKQAREIDRLRELHASSRKKLGDELHGANAYCDLLSRQLERAVQEHQQLAEEHNLLIVEARRQDDTIAELTQYLDEANAKIAELQRPPQMKLVGVSSTAAVGVAADDSSILDHTIEMACRLISVVFEGRTHWILQRDDAQFKVPVHDREFLESVHSGGQKFGAGYVIRGTFHEVTIRRGYDGELFTKRTLEKVLEVIPPPVQQTFNASPATAEASGDQS